MKDGKINADLEDEVGILNPLMRCTDADYDPRRMQRARDALKSVFTIVTTL